MTDLDASPAAATHPDTGVSAPPSAAARATTLLRRARPFIGLGVFALALWALYDVLHTYRYAELRAAVSAVPSSTLLKSLALTLAGYTVMAGYDLLAFRVIGNRPALSGIATASFISNALGNNFGNTLITGAAVRLWIYTALGQSAENVARVVVFCSVGFWLGLLFLGGVLFTVDPLTLPPALRLDGATTRPIGLTFLVVLGFYLALSGRRRPLRFGTRRIDLPTPQQTAGQIAIASMDLSLMAGALYVLLPPDAHVGFTQCATAFLIALVAGNVSLVPGGLGVFESAMVLLLSPQVATLDLVTALLAFRAIYFILPVPAAAALIALRGTAPAVLQQSFEHGVRWTRSLAPRVLAALVFFAGTVLLFSGAVPAAAGRLAQLHEVIALPVIEASHFMASLAGAALLLLARGLYRRLDAAWLFAVLLLAIGAASSLAKGFDFEEAIVVGIPGLMLLRFRRQFYRHSSLLGEPFTAPWVAAILIVLTASVWLVLFAHEHATYAAEPWWHFALYAEASRSLRATVGAVGLAALFALYRLVRPLRPRIPQPSAQDVERARPIVERSAWTYANLVFRGDKALLFSDAGDAFLMYGRRGRSWIAMGDPVGSDEDARELVWRYRDLCDRFDGWCVFFEVRPQRREQYVDLGLALTPLGEEARVPLASFSLDAPVRKDLRQSRAKLLRRGCRFEIVPREAVPALLPALASISAAWLARKATREKGFSNASFDIDYLKNFPAAVVRCEDRVVAFANLWLGAGKEELSVDLMRHLPDAPNGTMDLLFTELMLWGRAQGFRWFNFGMAPLSGLDAQSGSPVWKGVATFVFRHGEHFYNFEGLRRYKAKFGPAWTPLYLASPGGVALAPILIDVAALIAGGATGIVRRSGLIPGWSRPTASAPH